jgi:DNA-binding NarL/FixJ family response regulator
VSPGPRVLVVDDQQLIREGIASLLAIQPGLTVVGTAADGRQALDQIAALDPDIVLMDVRMPVLDGVEATAAVRDRFPACRVIMLTTFDDEDYVVRALRAGASGYLLKDLPAADLASAVRLVHAGVDQHDPSVTRRLMAALSRGDTPDPAVPATSAPPEPAASTSGLTGRERDVLRLIAGGASNREIAGRLNVGEGTVKNHVSSILIRLGLRDRTQAALYARDHNLR